MYEKSWFFICRVLKKFTVLRMFPIFEILLCILFEKCFLNLENLHLLENFRYFMNYNKNWAVGRSVSDISISMLRVFKKFKVLTLSPILKIFLCILLQKWFSHLDKPLWLKFFHYFENQSENCEIRCCL